MGHKTVPFHETIPVNETEPIHKFQMLNTCGVTLGILMTFKSRAQDKGYPTFEALLIGFTNMFTSLLSGMTLYGIIGHIMTLSSE